MASIPGLHKCLKIPVQTSIYLNNYHSITYLFLLYSLTLPFCTALPPLLYSLTLPFCTALPFPSVQPYPPLCAIFFPMPHTDKKKNLTGVRKFSAFSKLKGRDKAYRYLFALLESAKWIQGFKSRPPRGKNIYFRGCMIG